MLELARQLDVKRDFFGKYFRAGNFEDYSAEYVKQIQKNNLENLLRHSLTHSTFYREYYREHGITLGDIPEIEIHDLPFVDKQIVMDNYDELVCSPELKKKDLLDFIADPNQLNKKYQGRYVIVHSSGSSGNTGIFAYDDKDFNNINVIFMKYVYNIPLLKMLRQKIAFLGATGGHYAAFTSIARTCDYHISFLPLSVETPLDEVITKLNSFQPTFLLAYSSMLEETAKAKMDGVLKISPGAVYSGGEKLLHSQAKTIKAAFDIAPHSIYGASESVIIGADTSHEEGMYLFSHFVIMETLNDQDQAVGNNEYGRGVLTNLYNYSQPLIRYRMDDILSIDRQPANAHLPFERINDIEGRAEDFLEFEKNGKRVFIHPLIFVEFYVNGLKQLQIIKDSAYHLTLRVSLEDRGEQILREIRQKMQEILHNLLLTEIVRFDIEIVEQIPNDPKTGKFKLIQNNS